MIVTRRGFLESLSVLGLGLTVSGRIGLANDISATGPRESVETGIMTQAEKDGLWQMYTYVGKRWNSIQFDTLGRKGFEAVLDLKTSRPPSYLAEYRATLKRFRELAQKAELETALEQLFSETEAATHRHVLAEFVELHLAHGGFRAFGWQNYRGNMGGSFSEETHPPYRIYQEPK